MMMLTTAQLIGTFEDAIVITTVDQLDQVVYADMRDEIRKCLLDGSEPVIYYATWCYEGDTESTHYALFPEVCRGAVCVGTGSSWCDAATLTELEYNWQNGNMD
jgi:hypothetical protein